MSAPRVLVVPAEHSGERLDAFAAASLGVARGYARRLIARGHIRVRGRAARKGMLVGSGDRIEVAAFRHPNEGILPAPDLELRVLHAAGGWVAIDKPAGLPTHPLDFDEHHTASNAFIARHPEALHVGHGGLEPGLVHRLDTGTSGVLLFASQQAAWERARRAFEEGRAHKRYLARVHGKLEGSLELRLELAHRGPRMRVVASGGQPTHTRVYMLESEADASLLEIDLLTGVRHQIRASLAHVGHPILGDVLYGSPLSLGRHLLHAWSLRIDDFYAEAPIPTELMACR